jgi:hypothetical protein
MFYCWEANWGLKLSLNLWTTKTTIFTSIACIVGSESRRRTSRFDSYMYWSHIIRLNETCSHVYRIKIGGIHLPNALIGIFPRIASLISLPRRPRTLTEAGGLVVRIKRKIIIKKRLLSLSQHFQPPPRHTPYPPQTYFAIFSSFISKVLFIPVGGRSWKLKAGSLVMRSVKSHLLSFLFFSLFFFFKKDE